MSDFFMFRGATAAMVVALHFSSHLNFLYLMTQQSEFPNGLRPVFDVWSVEWRHVISVTWMFNGRYSLSESSGSIGFMDQRGVLLNLATGNWATLPENHDQK